MNSMIRPPFKGITLIGILLVLWLSYRSRARIFTALFSTIGSRIVDGFRNQKINGFMPRGVLIVALCWILWSFFFFFFGGLPLCWANPSLVLFEVGFVDSILNDVQ